MIIKYFNPFSTGTTVLTSSVLTTANTNCVYSPQGELVQASRYEMNKSAKTLFTRIDEDLIERVSKRPLGLENAILEQDLTSRISVCFSRVNSF